MRPSKVGALDRDLVPSLRDSVLTKRQPRPEGRGYHLPSRRAGLDPSQVTLSSQNRIAEVIPRKPQRYRFTTT